jgi:putative ABC transport system permease protein
MSSTGNSPSEPPRLAERVLAFCLPAGPRGQCVLGDLRQEYASICRASNESAPLWYWKQTAVIGGRYLIAKLGRSPRAPRRVRGRERPSMSWLGVLLQDLRYAGRTFAKKPGFSLTVVALVALGVGATTTIFSVVDNVLLRALPYPDPEELVFLDDPAHSAPMFVDWRDRTSSFSVTAATMDTQYDLIGDGAPESIEGSQVTEDFFSMLGARAIHGRLFAPDDFVGSPPRVAVIGHGLWQRRWGSDASVVGRTITLNGNPVQVVGVLDPAFRPPGAMLESTVQAWLPLDLAQEDLQNRGKLVLVVIARLRPGTTLESAQADIDTLSVAAAEEYPNRPHLRRDGSARMYQVISLHAATVGDAGNALYLMLGAVGLMLLISIVNVANLFLARATDRSRETALRAALGAGRGRILAERLTESISLALAGGALGVALAVAGVAAFNVYSPGGIPRINEISVDLRVLAVTFLLSIITGTLFGIVPAIQATRSDVREAISEAASSVTESRRRVRLRSTLVVAEIAIALMLLVGAGLLFNSFVRLSNVDTGFNAENIMGMRIDLGDRFSEEQRLLFTGDLTARLEAIPGVEGVAASTTLPPTGGSMCCWGGNLIAEVEVEDQPMAIFHPVTPGYFGMLDARIVRGRGLTEDDNDAVLGSAVISESAARFLFADADPIGRDFKFRDVPLNVVGVVNDIRHWRMDRSEGHNVYAPHAVFGGRFRFLRVGVKSSMEPAVLAEAMRAAVWAVDPDLPVREILPLEQTVASAIAQPRFLSMLLSTFAVLAILLAAGGIYGSMLYSVGQRNREIGIRMALGAREGNVTAMILRSGLRLTLIGIALGLAGAFALSRTVESMLFGIERTDPLTFAAVSVLLGSVALAACYLPARKAAKADPIETLRAQ